MFAVLRRALGQAVKWGLVARNVATLIDAPTASTREVESLGPDQARILLSAVRDDRLEAMYSVALALGLRKGEILGLRWKDVDLESGKLAIRGSLQGLNGKLWRFEPKTKTSYRTLRLPQTAIASLHTHRARQLEERLLAGSRWQDTGYVFVSTIGTPLDPRNVTTHFNLVLRKAGLPKMRFHDLRHTCASLMLAQGIQARVVMEILGHSQIGVTMNTYSHVIPELQQDAAAKMDALLTGRV